MPNDTAPPRTLARHEHPEPGDVFCESEVSIPALVIRIGTASDLNHAGIVVGHCGPDGWVSVEAVGAGVISHTRQPPNGYVVRVTNDPTLRAAIADAACELANAGTRYGWITLGWQAGRVVARSRVFGFLGRLIQKLTAHAASNDRGRICSEVAAEAIRRAVAANPGPAADAVAAAMSTLDGSASWQIAPSDLFRALAGRADWAEHTCEQDTASQTTV